MELNEKKQEEEAAKDERFLREKMNPLRDEYDSIPVPEEAKKRLLLGIQQAEAENSKKEHKRKPKKVVSFFSKAVLLAAAFLAVFTLAVNVSPVTARAMSTLPVIGKLARVMTFRTFEDAEGGFTGKVAVPGIAPGDGAPAAANQEIEAYANSLISMYESDLRAANGEGNYSLQSDWDVVYEDDTYVCIRIQTTLVMASGTQYVKVFTVNKATGETVSLKELLGSEEKLKAVSDNIKEQMRAEMKADENKIYFIDSDTPAYDFKGLTGDESYYFSKDGELIISFDEYTVAPGYMGAVSFTIPKSVTGDLL